VHATVPHSNLSFEFSEGSKTRVQASAAHSGSEDEFTQSRSR